MSEIKGKMITFECDVCGKEKTSKLYDYNKNINHFCSRECYNLFQSSLYGCKEGYQKCSKCHEEKPFNEFHKNGENDYKSICKVCSFLNSHKSLVIINNWDIDEYRIILDNLLNKKVDCINEIIPLLSNKILNDLANLLTFNLKIKATEIKIKDYCEQCNKDIYRPLAYYHSAEHHFCSKECFDLWQITSVNTECANCGKKISVQPNKLEKNKNVFCCHKCSTDFTSKQAIEIRYCEECGIEFSCLQSSKQKLCSKECRYIYFSKNYSGENNGKYSQFNINCDWCGTEFKINPAHYDNVENHFCSIDCRQHWFKEVYSQTDEMRNRTRIQTLRLLEEGLIPKSRTGIHKIICSLLMNNNISIIEEKSFDFYSIDIYLKDYNLAIEIMGKFWHCDNRKYYTINYESQLNAIRKDKSKHTYFKNKGINILYLWEDEINNNLPLCVKLIEEYIQNNGILKNYHSFNYCLSNINDILLTDNIIIPYMDYDCNDISPLIDLSVKEKISRKQLDKWITFNCDQCGKEKEVRLIHYSRCKNHFCSQECKAQFENTSVKVNCFNCNKEYEVEVSKYNKNEKFFCCKQCEIDYKKPEMFKVNCDYCNKLIEVKKIQAHNFCDRKCYDDYIATNIKGTIQKDKWITFNCEVCQKECSQLIANFNKHHHHFCGKECHDIFQNKGVIKCNCDNCGKELVKDYTDYHKSIHHFCNTSCAVSFNNKHRHKNKSS